MSHPAHPYAAQPAHAFWAQGVAAPAAIDPASVDPVVAPAFRVARRARIASAGSCFAQHLPRHLRAAGLRPFVAEQAHPIVPAAVARRFGYGDLGARYGPVYTARQLLQLLRRAFGEFVPADDAWAGPDGRWLDPFRPRIQPGGYLSREELAADRARHFDAVRRLFTQLDVLVFTLGLTEAWADRADGAVYPLCPGVAGGQFDPGRHTLLQLGVAEVVDDLEAFVERLRAINPRARLILTVSPVALAATAGDRHVLVATGYSKSVLRVAAEQLSRRHAGIAYFPAYEIVTGGFHRGRYLGDDLREVSEAGVAHVMRLFLQHYLGLALPAAVPAEAPAEGGGCDPCLADAAARQCDEGLPGR